MNKKIPRGSEYNIIHDEVAFIDDKHNKFEFRRNCSNCTKKASCKRLPHKNSMKRYTEWCDIFMPDYGRIDRLRAGRAKESLMNPNSLSGAMANVQASSGMLNEVEEVLNSAVSVLGGSKD